MSIQILRVYCVLQVIGLAWGSRPVMADLVVTAENAWIVASTVETQATVRVYLDFTGTDDGGSVDIGNFGLNLMLDGPAAGTDVSIIDIGDTSGQAFPLGIKDVNSPVSATGSTVNVGGAGFSVADAGPNGLMQVVLKILPNVSGTYTLSITKQEFTAGVGGGAVALANPVSATLTVPEPSAFACVGIVGLAICLRQRLYRKQ